MRFKIDKLGVVIAALLAYGAFLAPFANFRANRIVPGEPRAILDALPPGLGMTLLAFIAVALVLVVLEDDKGVQPVYQPAPIIRVEVLKANPQIEELLKPVFEKLDLVTLQDLNGRVQVGGEPAKAVAEDFLKKNGFIK